VSHEKLLYRLHCYGISGNLLQWLRNFLTGRTHCTRVSNCISEICNLLSGVIQGRNIGPLLFICFINELAEILGPMFVTAKFFADDLKVNAEVLTTIDVDCFQFALDRITAWCNDWQLQITVKKCSILNIGPTTLSINFQIDGNVLPAVSKVKDLGIAFDSNLSATSHVRSVVVTANQRVNLLLRSFLTRNRYVLVKAYIAYVRPILEYGSVVWSPYETGDISCIEQVQRSFTKRLPGLKNVAYRDRLAVTNLDFHTFFHLAPSNNTRGHRYKLFVEQSTHNVRYYFL